MSEAQRVAMNERIADRAASYDVTAPLAEQSGDGVLVGWRRTDLASLGDYINGFAFNQEYWSDTGLPIVRIAQITGSQGIVDRFPGTLSNAYRLTDGDIIFSWSGTLAVVRWQGGPAWLNQHLFKVVPNADVNCNYLYHVLQASVAEMAQRAHGSTMKHIKRGELREFSLEVPDNWSEQAVVARVLDTLDTAIRQTEAIIAKLKQVKQGLLHDLLTCGIDANGELRPPQPQAPHLYKQSPLGWIPATWADKSLDEIAAAPICYGIVQVFDFVPYGAPVLAIRDLLGDFATNIHRTALSIDAAYSRSRVQPGDVLISVKGTIGRIAVVPSHFVGNISRDIARIRPDTAVRPSYLCQLLRSPVGQRILALAQVGSTRAELSIAPLRRLRFPMPSLEEQEFIERALEAHDSLVRQESSDLSKLREAKAGLMDDLLTGRVRVTPLLEATTTP
jgi:type I restriction enzyme S subunit